MRSCFNRWGAYKTGELGLGAEVYQGTSSDRMLHIFSQDAFYPDHVFNLSESDFGTMMVVRN